MTTPRALAEEQLCAYNNRDIEAFCAAFSDDVIVYSLKDGKVLSEGKAAFRNTYGDMFAGSPALHAKILHRIEVGDFVIDHEEVTGRRGADLKAVAIYKVTNNKISHVWFAQ